MEPHYTDTLRTAREQANRQIVDLRERAIVIRYIEDALCRAYTTTEGALPPLSK